jgi:hypothetical protein
MWALFAVATALDLPKVGLNTLSLQGGGTAAYQYASQGGTPAVMNATANISSADLNTGTEPTSPVRRYARNMGTDNDDAGHILANRLGGPAVPTNIFPQAPHINRGAYEHYEAKIYACVQKGQGNVTLSWRFTYASATATRPTGVQYNYTGSGCSDSQSFSNPDDSDGFKDIIV